MDLKNSASQHFEMRKNVDEEFANIVHVLLGVLEDLLSKCRLYDWVVIIYKRGRRHLRFHMCLEQHLRVPIRVVGVNLVYCTCSTWMHTRCKNYDYVLHNIHRARDLIFQTMQKQSALYNMEPICRFTTRAYIYKIIYIKRQVGLKLEIIIQHLQFSFNPWMACPSPQQPR